MPAKRKSLPRPCPKCGKSYGTIQIVIFFDYNRNVICRIGHYDADGYRKIKKINKLKRLDPKNHDNNFQKDVRIKQRKWCSFRIDRKFAEFYILPLDDDFEYLENGKHVGRFRKSITYPKPSFLGAAIKEKGWHMLPDYSYKYRSGKYTRNQHKKQEIIFQPLE